MRRRGGGGEGRGRGSAGGEEEEGRVGEERDGFRLGEEEEEALGRISGTGDPGGELLIGLVGSAILSM